MVVAFLDGRVVHDRLAQVAARHAQGRLAALAATNGATVTEAPAAEAKPKKAPAKPKAEKAAAEPKAEKTTKAKAEKPAAEKKPAAKKAAPKADKE